MKSTVIRNIGKALTLPVFGAILLLLQTPFANIFAAQNSEAHPPGPILSAFFSVFLLAVFLGCGLWVVRASLFDELDRVEKLLFAFGLGTGLFSSVFLVFGLGRILTSGIVLGVVFLAAFPASLRIAETVALIRWRESFRTFLAWKSYQKAIAAWIFVLIAFSMFQAVTPVWDADGLIYHLSAPQKFLESGAIVSDLSNPAINYPLAVELLFLPGLAAGVDISAKWIHLAFAVCLLMVTFLLARKMFPGPVSWLAVLAIGSMPIYWFWASLAYADMGWAFFQVISLYALWIWRKTGKAGWLGISAVFCGWALSSKYLAVCWWGILLLIVIAGVGNAKGKNRLQSIIMAFGIPLVIWSPWLIRNIAAFGNPFFPLDIPVLWPASGEQAVWVRYMQGGFGAGRTWLDYLLLPWNLYRYHGDFATFGGSIEIPSFLFPFALLAILDREGKANVRALGMIAVGLFLFWAIGAQQIRLLLPVFPMLAILAGVGMTVAGRFLSAFLQNWRVLAWGILGGVGGVAVVYGVLFFSTTKPLDTLLTRETRVTFLERMVSDYPAQEYILHTLPEDAKVLMVWDARGYYCPQKCVPDYYHAKWTSLVHDHPAPEAVAEELRHQGITHLLISRTDIEFLLGHDPGGVQRDAWNYLQNIFITPCAKEVYSDTWTQLLEITCHG